ncbi:MAG: Stp1/IreP family PP2C-type Ser/Thr phosphatase [Acidobacteriaceae bacterium]
MSQIQAVTLDFAAATDVGCRRANNEDSFGYDAEEHIYAVCDGMGGSAAGEVASGMAVRALVETFADSAPGSSAGTALQTAEERLLAAIRLANDQVRQAALENPALQTMGTTLVCACLDGGRMLVGNVGDSRAYLLRDGSCVQITQDHSFLEEQIRAGRMTPEMASFSDLQSVITRAIGAADSVEPDLFAAPVRNDDLFLLASDGLTRYAAAEEIAEMAGKHRDLQAICLALIDHAKQLGGADNITCLLLRVVEIPAESREEEAVAEAT